MTRIVWAAASLAFALSACVQQRIERAIGRPVDDVAREIGPPARISAIDANTRLYIWTKKANLKPGPAPLTEFRPIAEYAQNRRAYSVGNACAYRLIARRDASGAWLVDSVLSTSALCT